jgi:hypothetical protein
MRVMTTRIFRALNKLRLLNRVYHKPVLLAANLPADEGLDNKFWQPIKDYWKEPNSQAKRDAIRNFSGRVEHLSKAERQLTGRSVVRHFCQTRRPKMRRGRQFGGL